MRRWVEAKAMPARKNRAEWRKRLAVDPLERAKRELTREQNWSIKPTTG